MSGIIYLGVKGSVVAIDKKSGREIWRSRLRGSQFTTLLVEEDIVFAHTNGHLYALDPKNGRQIWHNNLPGLGHGIAALAVRGASSQESLAQLQAQNAAAGAAAAAAVAGVSNSADSG